MTQKEKEIIDLIIQNPNLKQNELADLLNISRMSVAVHISNLMKRNIILGKQYVLDKEVMEKELNGETLFVKPLENKKINKVICLSNLSKYTSYLTHDKNILKNIKYSSLLHNFLQYLLDQNNKLEVKYVTNLNLDNSYNIISSFLNKNLVFDKLKQLDNTNSSYICVDNQCFIETRKIKKSEYDILSTSYDYYLLDSSISLNLVLENKDKKFCIFIEEDKQYLKDLLKIKDISKVEVLVLSIDLFESKDLEFIRYQLINNYKIKNVVLILEDRIAKITNKEIIYEDIVNIQKVVYDSIFR